MAASSRFSVKSAPLAGPAFDSRRPVICVDAATSYCDSARLDYHPQCLLFAVSTHRTLLIEFLTVSCLVFMTFETAV